MPEVKGLRKARALKFLVVIYPRDYEIIRPLTSRLELRGGFQGGSKAGFNSMAIRLEQLLFHSGGSQL